MIITRTPFRISFLGGGTDYPVWFRNHPGAVLATSIDKYCYLTCRYLPEFFEHRSRVLYSKVEMVKNNADIQHPVVREALRVLGIEAGVEIHHDGDLPARSGIGSSSAFTVGLLHALHALEKIRPTQSQLAAESIEIEQSRLRENVGSQDPVTCSFGGLNRIDFEPKGGFRVSPCDLQPARQTEFEQHLLLLFTGISRTASEVAREQIEQINRHENRLMRMYAMVEEGGHILNGDGPVDSFGELLHESWMLKRELSPRISTPAVDEAYEQARAAGAAGGKLLGAGGGGFLLVFAKPDRHADILRRLNKFLHVPFRFESAGTQLIFDGPANDSSRA